MSHPFSLIRRIGPAVVVAAVVLGPGSIVSASRVGCQFGYALVWVIPVVSAMLIAMTMTGMAIGATQKQTPCQAVAESFGRPAALLVGLSMLVAITMFQASNNNALLMAAEGFWVPADTAESTVAAENESATDEQPSIAWTGILIPLAFNGVVIALLWASRRDLYRHIEKAMAWMVGLMVLAFAINLVFAGPSLSSFARGLIPSLPPDLDSDESTAAWMTVGAMVATTFSVAAAFYQAYQVREKGWTVADLAVGRLDVYVGISSLALITMMILVTAAAALHQTVAPADLTDAAAVARALEPLFGRSAQYVFAAGVLAGAVSSFVVNALIGAVVFCDSVGWSTKLSDQAVRRTTVAVLLLGWAVAAIGVLTQTPLAEFIVIAQGLTVIAFPVLALTLIWQSRRLPSGALPTVIRVLNYAGLGVTVMLSIRTVFRLIAS